MENIYKINYRDENGDPQVATENTLEKLLQYIVECLESGSVIQEMDISSEGKHYSLELKEV